MPVRNFMNQVKGLSMKEDMSVYFSGKKLYGEDLSPEEIEQWFTEEVEGFISEYAGGRAAYYYGYHAMNERHGFRFIRDRVFEEVLGMGCAYGGEFEPFAKHIKKIILFEPLDEFADITDIYGTPAEFVKPSPDGRMPFDDNRFDLITNLGVMNHIPNVSYVLSECHRCLQKGGIMLLRIPIVTQGDWRQQRIGLTKNSRGIPLQLAQTMVKETGFSIKNEALCFFPLMPKLTKLTGMGGYENHYVALADALFSKAFAWNLRYHMTSLYQKISPQCVYMVLEK